MVDKIYYTNVPNKHRVGVLRRDYNTRNVDYNEIVISTGHPSE